MPRIETLKQEAAQDIGILEYGVQNWFHKCLGLFQAGIIELQPGSQCAHAHKELCLNVELLLRCWCDI